MDKRSGNRDNGDSEASDDDLCDYEKKRLENIRKNHGMLRSLGPCTSKKHR